MNWGLHGLLSFILFHVFCFVCLFVCFLTGTPLRNMSYSFQGRTPCKKFTLKKIEWNSLEKYQIVKGHPVELLSKILNCRLQGFIFPMFLRGRGGELLSEIPVLGWNFMEKY